MTATRQCAHPWEPPRPVRRAEGEYPDERIVAVFGVLVFVLVEPGIVLYVMQAKEWRAYWEGIEVKRPQRTRRAWA